MITTISKWEAKEHYDFFASLPKNVGTKSFMLFKFDGVEIFKSQYQVVSNMVKSIETEEYQNYDNERISIVKQYAKKDSFGRIITANGEVEVDPANVDEAQGKVSELNEKYKDVIVEHDKNYNEIWELTHKETVEVDSPQIKFDDIPEGLSETEMNYIFKYFLVR